MWCFPDFEAPGSLDPRTTPVWPCNFFNRVDNDPVHVAFVHRDGPYQRGIPVIHAEENDSGMVIHSTHSDGTTGQSYHHMPNVSHFTARPRVMLEGGARVTGFRQSLGFRIPVDDEHHKVLSVDHVKVSGEVARSYAEGLQDLGHWSGPDLEALGEAVLRGEFHSDDIEDRRNITQVQDYAALVGQGRIADHPNEHLGASDRSVVFFRQLWMRELRALAEGRSLKQWKGAGDLSALRDP
ncbi:MAG: pobA 2 [Chloroflexi bacterium]|nr:pobA 2 [Chloroflexota bacterium]